MKTTRIFATALFFIIGINASAWRPVAHAVLKNVIVDSLPDSNIFKIAMEKHPYAAAWGAVGPDMGYNIDLSRLFKPGWKKRMKETWQYAEISHYNKVGTFLKNMVNAALESKDSMLISFVGGWITHVAGDFGSHGIYVKPEAGYYISFPDGRDLHGELEKLADTYIYHTYSNSAACTSKWKYDVVDYWPELFGVPSTSEDDVSRRMVKKKLRVILGKGEIEKFFLEVYRKTYFEGSKNRKPELDMVKNASTYQRSVGVGLGKTAGFEQYSVVMALNKLKMHQQLIPNLDKAFDFSKTKGVEYLIAASTGKMDGLFNDNWNLDIGEKGEPTYAIKISSKQGLGSGAKNKLYVQLKNKQGQVSEEELLTIKIGALTFMHNWNESYYYHVNLGDAMGETLDCWKIENIVWVKIISIRRKDIFLRNTLKVRELVVEYNGKPVGEPQKKFKMNNKHNERTIDVNKN
ncbi:MAG: zinc dependent phospholipase C family protein [Flavobacteriales bacterium]|nr:zinc dependent phospholipase C family protein [Flavobacteriales bacterium]